MDRSEAIKLVREYYPSSGKDLNEALETLIPELKDNESEDERIRKALVKEFEKKVQNGFEWKDGIPNNAVLAWLEKLGEQKLTGWTEEDEQIVRFYEAYTNNQVGNWPQNKVLEMKSKFNDWVKKVKYRVQPQWKPSKEQLTALEHVSSEYIGSWQPEMLTLFDDLKSLYDNHNKNKK